MRPINSDFQACSTKTAPPQALQAVSADIDRHAKTMANFYYGDVLAVDDIGPATGAQLITKTSNNIQELY